MYSVKQTAKMMGLSEHTIRYYSDQGLIPNLKRGKNNNREFDEEALNWLSTIKCLRECGMSIDAIREYCDLCLLGDASIEQRYQIILAQKQTALEQLEHAKKRVEYLQNKEQRYLDILNNCLPDNMNPENWQTKSTG